MRVKGKVFLCGIKIVNTRVSMFLVKLLHLECLCDILSQTVTFRKTVCFIKNISDNVDETNKL